MERLFAAMVLWALMFACHAEGVLFEVPTRDGVTTTVFWEPVANAKVTVVLFSGGKGGFGKVRQGKATSRNLLVRSEPYFVANGFNVAIFGLPSDSANLTFAERISAAHMTDVRKVLEFVKTKANAPVWLVGTSRGTISTTAAAIDEQGDIAGLVLTSSVVGNARPGAVTKQNLAAIRVPVLVLHNAKDTCAATNPHEVHTILQGLKNAPVKKEIMVSGGGNPTGAACGPLHWHGFIGMERDAVDLIAGWIKSPAN